MLTLRELVGKCCGELPSLVELEQWPPDVFALVAAFLDATGAYRLAVSPPPDARWPPHDGWQEEVADEGQDYVKAVAEFLAGGGWARARILDFWEPRLDEDLRALSHDWSFVQRCLRVLALADEACVGFGLPGGGGNPEADYRAVHLLEERGTCSSLDPDRIKVLPKTRTPQSGIDLRSLTMNVALVQGEVNVGWHQLPTSLDLKKLEVLLFPWPLECEASDFRPSPETFCVVSPQDFGFFEFQPREKCCVDDVLRLVGLARSICGGPHLVVFPESALDRTSFNQLLQDLSAEFGSNSPAVLAGIRERNDRNLPSNLAVLAFTEPGTGKWVQVTQHKHHRWFLNETQIKTYRLGAQLHPARKWWEAMDIPERRLEFFILADWLVFCPLICEDLARHDPVLPVVRSVGPTLVFALLLDGPQVSGRWASRYAAGLADDPGTSVLTLSSLGMVARSQAPRFQPSRCVAMWKDQQSGVTEIKLEEAERAKLLTLSVSWEREWTADGRNDDYRAAVIRLDDVRGLA
jgi:hypothetical protein